mmetsp:Transcript_71/g.184  ORF Transcript_71/g.184 Transcript_71/m.184 type:complete len:390 (-) Transcript_71:202-1371(-)
MEVTNVQVCRIHLCYLGAQHLEFLYKRINLRFTQAALPCHLGGHCLYPRHPFPKLQGAQRLLIVLRFRGHVDHDGGGGVAVQGAAKQLREHRVAEGHMLGVGAQRPDHLAQRSERPVDCHGLRGRHALHPSLEDALGSRQIHKQELLLGHLALLTLYTMQMHKAVRARRASVQRVSHGRASQLDRERQLSHLHRSCEWQQLLAHGSKRGGLQLLERRSAGQHACSATFQHFPRSVGQGFALGLSSCLLRFLGFEALAALAVSWVHTGMCSARSSGLPSLKPRNDTAASADLPANALAADLKRGSVGEQVISPILVHLNGRSMQCAAAAVPQKLERDPREDAPRRRGSACRLGETRLRQAARWPKHRVSLTGSRLSICEQSARVTITESC